MFQRNGLKDSKEWNKSRTTILGLHKFSQMPDDIAIYKELKKRSTSRLRTAPP
jgi:hypothetical protein